MATFEKKDYGNIAKKASILLKEGVGITQILNITNLDFTKLKGIKYRNK